MLPPVALHKPGKILDLDFAQEGIVTMVLGPRLIYKVRSQSETTESVTVAETVTVNGSVPRAQQRMAVHWGSLGVQYQDSLS